MFLIGFVIGGICTILIFIYVSRKIKGNGGRT
jgi:hypothetical protein